MLGTVSREFGAETALSLIFLSSLCQRLPKQREDNSRNCNILALGKPSIFNRACLKLNSQHFSIATNQLAVLLTQSVEQSIRFYLGDVETTIWNFR